MKSIVYELESPYTLVQKQLDLDDYRLASCDIVAETEYTAVSTGTEIAAWAGKPPLRPSKPYPRLVGYCNLAKIIKVGSSISDLFVGDYILTRQSHRSAFICNRSEVLLRVTVPSEVMRKKLTATYLYHLGYSALIAGIYKPGHQVAIIGMGTVGLATASLVKAFGSQPLLFTNQEIGKTPMTKMGFSSIFGKNISASEFRNQLWDTDGVDISINTSNKWSDYRLALQLVRKGGEVICIGFPGRGEAPPDFNPLDSQYFYDKQLIIRQSGYMPDVDVRAIDARFTVKRNIQYISGLILSGLVDTLDILSTEISWLNLDTVYKSLASREPGMYSALINWR
ncbi:MAG: zinc-binding dehydrogenase [Deltaproteobacteria bacterium]|nr:zinc-binding dehydrogenase [Deltaproteobacteria bacterium]